MLYALCWDGTDQAGRRLPAGVYHLVAERGGSQLSQRLVMMR
jgi:hypothetical protein